MNDLDVDTFTNNLWVDFCLKLAIQTYKLQLAAEEASDPSFDGKEFSNEFVDAWVKAAHENISKQVNGYVEDLHRRKEKSKLNKALGVNPEDLTARTTGALKTVKSWINEALEL